MRPRLPRLQPQRVVREGAGAEEEGEVEEEELAGEGKVVGCIHPHPSVSVFIHRSL